MNHSEEEALEIMDDWERFAWTTRRSALQDISTSSFTRGSPADANLVYVPDSYSISSPEEEIIQARRPKVLMQSAMLLHNDENAADFLQATPTSDLVSLSRKRLHMTPPSSPCASPYKMSPVKRPRLMRRVHSVELKTELQAYSTRQLIDIIDRLVIQHPALEEDVRDKMGVPDIKPVISELSELRKNVYKSIPTRPYGSSRDSFCYKHARIHLKVFKKSLIEQSQKIVLSQSWDTLVNFVLLAFPHVSKLPVWEDASHNATRIYCLKHLAAQCMIALKKGQFDKDQLAQFRGKLQSVSASSKEIKPCLDETTKLLEKISLS